MMRNENDELGLVYMSLVFHVRILQIVIKDMLEDCIELNDIKYLLLSSPWTLSFFFRCLD